MRKACLLVALVSLGFLDTVTPSLRAADTMYAPAGEIQVGGAGRFDYLFVDSAAHRLYLSHGTEVVVIDTAAQTVVGRIPDTPGVHGIAIAPNGKGFITAGNENKVNVFDVKTLQSLMKVDTGKNPDAITYDPGHKEIYSFDHIGKTATVINADTGAVVATIPLSGVVEAGTADPALNRVYVNIEDKSLVDVIDTKTHAVVAHWPVGPAEEPTGMAIDTARHRIFVGGGPFQVMLDGATGAVVGKVPICSGTDATAFDPGASLSMSSCGDGHITIAHVGPGDTMTVVQTLETARGARTMALDPATHRIYVAAAKFGPAAPGERPATLPDTLRVLVYAPK